MEHSLAMNIAVPLVGIAPLLMFFVLRNGKKKTKNKKVWRRSS